MYSLVVVRLRLMEKLLKEKCEILQKNSATMYNTEY